MCCRSNKLIAAEITQNINKDFYICLQFFFAFMHSLVAIEKSARLTLKIVWCMCVCVVSKVIRIECLYRGHCAIFYVYSTVSCPYKCTLEAVDFHRSRIGDLRHLHLETHNSLAFLYTLSRIRIWTFLFGFGSEPFRSFNIKNGVGLAQMLQSLSSCTNLSLNLNDPVPDPNQNEGWNHPVSESKRPELASMFYSKGFF